MVPSPKKYTELSNMQIKNCDVLEGNIVDPSHYYDGYNRPFVIRPGPYPHPTPLSYSIPGSSHFHQVNNMVFKPEAYENRVIENSGITIVASKEEKAANNNDYSTYDTLRMALNGNQLSILKSGHAILKGYQLAPSKVVVETEEFVAKFAAQIETDVMPTSLNFADPSFSSEFMLGTNLLAKIAQFRTRMPEHVKDLDDPFDQLSGAQFNIKTDYFFPDCNPFNGQKMTCDFFSYSSKPAHVQLKHFIFILLGRACKNPEDIQKHSWRLPDERYSPGGIGVLFPRDLYFSLQCFFLEYFNISWPELDVPFQELFSDLPFLQSYSDIKKRSSYSTS